MHKTKPTNYFLQQPNSWKTRVRSDWIDFEPKIHRMELLTKAKQILVLM